MTLLCLPSPAWLRLSKLLAEVTEPWWPKPDERHLRDRAFQCDAATVSAFAEEQGFTLVGCGNYTAVFSHPDAPDVVFKLNAGTRDRMEDYHRWLMHQTHTNLTRVHHVQSHGLGCVAVAEMLEPFGDLGSIPYSEVKDLLIAAGFPPDDLHAGNVMLRLSDMQSIVNDPSSMPDALRSDWVED